MDFFGKVWFFVVNSCQSHVKASKVLARPSHVQASQVQAGPSHFQSVQAGTSNVQSFQAASRLYELPLVPIFNTNGSKDLPQAQQINHFSISLNSQPPTPHSLAPPPLPLAKVP
jgi:hypothetical protein